jgi:hypothetical protein
MYFTINDKEFSVDQERTHLDMGLLCLKILLGLFVFVCIIELKPIVGVF